MHFNGALKPAPGRIYLLTMATGVLMSHQAMAMTFDVNDDIKGVWNTTLSAGVSMGIDNPDKNWIGTTNGGRANFGSFDDPRLNFRKGDIYSAPLKVLTDLDLRFRDDYGVFIRAKGWTDQRLEHFDAPHGHVPNAYKPDSRLDDSGFKKDAKFTGATVLDAYVWGNHEFSDTVMGSARFGNQVINWGESLFYPGVNQTNPIDVSALKRPGATIKEALLPVPIISASLSIKDITFEAYYQLKWKPFSTPGCGTFYSRGDLGLEQSSCDRLTLDTGPDATSGYAQRIRNKEPSDGGNYGFAARTFVTALDGEIGAYFVNESAKTPIFTYAYGAGQANPNAPFDYFFDYDIPDIKHYALTYSTELFDWSTSVELSHHKNLPLAVNTDDVTRAVLAGFPFFPTPPAGNMGGSVPPVFESLISGKHVVLGEGSMYDRVDKNQVQVSVMRVFDQAMGADSFLVMGEAVYQHLDNTRAGRRYGRSSPFGAVPQAGETCAQVNPSAAANNPSNCSNEGFVTNDAFGYQFMVEWSFSDAIGPVRLKPQLSFKHDVHGFSQDGFIIQGTKQYGAALRAEYLSKYSATLSALVNNNNRWDPDHDRDALSMSVGMTF